MLRSLFFVSALGFGAALTAVPPATADPQISPSASPPAAVSDPSESAEDYGAPLQPRTWYSLEDELYPSYDGLKKGSNQVNLRGQFPLGKLAPPLSLIAPGKLQLVKIKIPFVTSAPAGAVTGNGDATLVGLQYLGSKAQEWVVGSILRVPTASQSALGSGKWSIGPAVGYTLSTSKAVTGLYMQSFFSFAGPSSRASISVTELQPGFYVRVGRDWMIGTSQMKFAYSWENNVWNVVPIGLRIGRIFENNYRQLTAGFEAEKNLAHSVGVPGWVLRLNFKYRLLDH